MEKYTTFSIPIKSESDGRRPTVRKLRFIDSFRFIDGLLPSKNSYYYLLQ